MNRRGRALISVVALLPAMPALALPPEESEQGESQAIVYTNADLPPALPESAVSSSPAAASGAPEPTSAFTASPEPMPSYDGHRDRDGHGEGWWRYRAALLDLECLAAQLLAEQLHVDYVKGKTLTDPTLAARSREATLAWQALEAQRVQLPEEMRQAGGLPGWLRRGDSPLPSSEEPLPAPVPGSSAGAEEGTVSWKPVPGAAFYLIEAQCTDCCGLMEPCEPRTLDVSGTSARLPFESGGSTHWRVRALDQAGFPGDWSNWCVF